MVSAAKKQSIQNRWLWWKRITQSIKGSKVKRRLGHLGAQGIIGKRPLQGTCKPYCMASKCCFFLCFFYYQTHMHVVWNLTLVVWCNLITIIWSMNKRKTLIGVWFSCAFYFAGDFEYFIDFRIGKCVEEWHLQYKPWDWFACKTCTE